MGNQPDFRAAHLANSYFALAAVERDLAEWDRAREAAENGLEVWRRVQNEGIRSIFRDDAARTESLLREH